jgi:hypothetical protein
MYSLDIREVKLSPALPEEKTFENEDRYALQAEAVSYITATHPDVYNPVTVERLVGNAIRDAEGKTFQEQFDEKEEASEKLFKESMAVKQGAADSIDEDYAPKSEALKDEFRSAADRIMDEYAAKIGAASPEERAALEEEQQTKLDELALGYRNTSDVLWNEQAEKKDAVWKEGSADF